jgi:hypothetical protein
VALTTSTINIAVLTLLDGTELGWVCLAACAADVAVNSLAVFWVTWAPTHTHSHAHSHPYPHTHELASFKSGFAAHGITVHFADADPFKTLPQTPTSPTTPMTPVPPARTRARTRAGTGTNAVLYSTSATPWEEQTAEMELELMRRRDGGGAATAAAMAGHGRWHRHWRRQSESGNGNGSRVGVMRGITALFGRDRDHDRGAQVRDHIRVGVACPSCADGTLFASRRRRRGIAAWAARASSPSATPSWAPG